MILLRQVGSDLAGHWVLQKLLLMMQERCGMGMIPIIWSHRLGPGLKFSKVIRESGGLKAYLIGKWNE